MFDDEGEPAPAYLRGYRLAAAMAVVVVAVAVGLAGAAGLIVSVSLVAVAVAAVALFRVPAAPDPVRRRRPGPPVENAPFRSYRLVAEALSWAEVSPRHYDLMTRPLLVQVFASRLADHHRVDLAVDPSAARRLVGDDVWHWLDPDREVDRRGQPPGVDLTTLTRIVDRLESL